MSLNITITSDAKEAIQRLREFPDKLRAAIAVGMNKENHLAIQQISRTRIIGDGPYPPSQHKLGVITNLLRNSLNQNHPSTLTTSARIEGNTIISSIGTNVEYAGVHEFGFSGSIFVNSHTRKSHLRQTKGKKRRSRVAEAIVTGHGRNVDIPARAPIEHGLKDYEPEYGRGISAAIVEAWQKHIREARP